MSSKRALVMLGIALLIGGCAQVPRESVELSTTVGRDLLALRESHRQMAEALFGRMKRDVNRFVDDVYAPFQIQFVLDAQRRRQASGEANNLFSVLDRAAKSPGNAQAQNDAIDYMQAVVELVREDVEDYRKLRLEPVLEQEREVTAAIERVYRQIIQANAVTTAHLASVVKVHEVQDEVLEGAELAGLREKIGAKLSAASSRLADFVGKARRAEGSIDKASAHIEKLTKEIDGLVKGE